MPEITTHFDRQYFCTKGSINKYSPGALNLLTRGIIQMPKVLIPKNFVQGFRRKSKPTNIYGMYQVKIKNKKKAYCKSTPRRYPHSPH